MTEYDIYREKLAIKHPSYGHALWEPSPRKPHRPVQIGDVGFIRRGRFHPFFNALLPADDPSQERGVPEYHEPLVPTSPDHFDTSSLDRNHYCSAGVGVEPDPGYNSCPDDYPKVSFQYNGTRGAAVLSLPVAARREDTIALGDFKRWIVKHIDSWFAFAQRLGFGIEHMEEIILVTGCDRTRSWANVAFLGSQVDSKVSFGVQVGGLGPRINFQFSPENARGAVLRHGPEGTNLPENQCVFIRGFRVARSLWILPRRLKAAAGPSSDPGGYDCDPDTEVISIPTVPKYRDPLHLLLDYIAEQASDCDMVLAHDDDLVTIDGLGHDTSLETLEPDVMMDLLRKSNIEIDKVLCDLSPTDNGPNTDTSVVKIAMLSMKMQNRDIGTQSQRLPHAGQNIDLDHAGESCGSSPPPLPGSLPVPTIRGDTSKRENVLLENCTDSAPSTLQDLADNTIRRVGHVAEDVLLAFGKTRISPSNVWQNLNGKFAFVKHHRLLSAVVVTCCAVSLLRWVFSLAWDIIFKLFITFILASIPLSVWVEREYMYRRRLDDVYERLEALQHVVSLQSLQLNQAEPAVADDVRYSLPIMVRAAPSNRDMLGQSSAQGIIQPAISLVDTNDVSEESIIGFGDLGDRNAERRTRRPGPDIDSPTPTPSQHSSNPIEHNPPVSPTPDLPSPTRSSSVTTVPLPRISTSSRPASPVLPNQATDMLALNPPPPADVRGRPRTLSFFNSIKNASTRLPTP